MDQHEYHFTIITPADYMYMYINMVMVVPSATMAAGMPIAAQSQHLSPPSPPPPLWHVIHLAAKLPENKFSAVPQDNASLEVVAASSGSIATGNGMTARPPLGRLVVFVSGAGLVVIVNQ